MDRKQEFINDIMDNLDWVKIQSTMRFLNWTWSGDDEPPSIHRMMECVRELIEGLEEHNSQELGTGGFCVRGNRKDGYSVSFQVSQWDNYHLPTTDERGE